MATASAILDDVRVKYGDTAKDLLSDSLALTWLDQAQKELCTHLMPLKRHKGFTLSANQDSFTVPDDVILIEVVTTMKGIRRQLKRVSPGEFRQQQSMIQDATGDPVIWTELDGRVYVWPRFPSASLTTTVNASTTETVTTITLSSTGNLRSNGMVRINSEDIEYTGKTTTTITGCSRGRGGTTAASHASAATVTQLDFELLYSRHATTLSAQTDELEVKEIWHYPTLQYYIMYLAYMAEGSADKARAMYEMFQGRLEEAKQIARKRHNAGPLSVRDFETQRVTGFFGPVV